MRGDLKSWFEERTGLGGALRSFFFESIPGGPRWRYVWGATVIFALGMEFITGFGLWLSYSAGTGSAWESVHYIQNATTGGALLRGLHRWTADLLVVLLVAHLAQIVIDRAYRAPREIAFWLSLAVMGLTLAIARTGYLLPWDQESLWGTKVAVGYLDSAPVAGNAMATVAVGGTEYGHASLTRFLALHAGILPLVLVVLLIARAALVRRQGRAVAAGVPEGAPTTPYWPRQMFRDVVACAVFLGVVLVFVAWKGTALGSPADVGRPFDAARPDWYFMWLFTLVKFEGFGGAAVWVPALLGGFLFLMPFIGRSRVGHFCNLAVLLLILGTVVALSAYGFRKDAKNEIYHADLAAAEAEAARVGELITLNGGIPPEGALALMRTDPLIQGPRVFASQCASCHAYDGHDGKGSPRTDKQSAPDLKGFASRAWIEGLLDPEKIATAHYFGGTAFVSKDLGGTGTKNNKMVDFVIDEMEMTPEERTKLAAAISAQAALKSQAAADVADKAMIDEGWNTLIDDVGCLDCHSVGDEDGSAQDLKGYGSRQWMIDFIEDPGHERFYGKKNDRMPAFGEKGKELLTPEQIGLVVDWLREEWPTASGSEE